MKKTTYTITDVAKYSRLSRNTVYKVLHGETSNKNNYIKVANSISKLTHKDVSPYDLLINPKQKQLKFNILKQLAKLG